MFFLLVSDSWKNPGFNALFFLLFTVKLFIYFLRDICFESEIMAQAIAYGKKILTILF